MSLNDLLWSCDAISLYPSAMSVDMSIYLRIETGLAFTPDINDEIVKNFNEGNLTQGSAILKIKHYDPKKLVVQHLPVKDRVKKLEINRMRNCYFVDTLTSVDIQEIVKIGGKVIENYGGVFYRETFKVSLFKKVIDKKFELGQKLKMKITMLCHCLLK